MGAVCHASHRDDESVRTHRQLKSDTAVERQPSTAGIVTSKAGRLELCIVKVRGLNREE